MGLADAVPGVSGGTVLLVAGALDVYLASLAHVLGLVRQPFNKEQWRLAFQAARVLIPLVAAQVSCLIIGVLLLVGKKPELGDTAAAASAALQQAAGLLVNPATAPTVFAIFFALVAIGLTEPWRARKSTHVSDWILAVVGAAIAAGMSLSPAAAGTPPLWLIAVGGAIAISVMILPGISGSLALLLLGLYQPVSAAVHDRDLIVVAAFAGGVLGGLAIAVPALRALLAWQHDRTMAFLTGLMAGSLVALWPWKLHYFPGAIPLLGPMTPQLPSGAWWWPVAAAVVAGGLGWVALRYAARRQLAHRS